MKVIFGDARRARDSAAASARAAAHPAIAVDSFAAAAKAVTAAANVVTTARTMHATRSFRYSAATAIASIAAASSDANAPGNWRKLWHGSKQPPDLAQAWQDLKAQWNANDADWSFWIEWYEAILNGTPLDWKLTQRIALDVTEEQWDAGQAVVAERIAEIRRDFEGSPLDQEALHIHVQQLAQSPVLNADVAESAGLQIEAAIRDYKAEAPANTLPNGFDAFEALAPTFLRISAALSVPAGTSPDVGALQEEISHLHSIIAQLRTDLRDARACLADARLSALEAQKTRTFGEKLKTTLTCVTLLGTIGMGTAWFFGVPTEDLKYESLKGALQDLSRDMENAQPDPETPNLPIKIDT